MTTKSITIDAKGKILGRVASEAVHILRGKNTPSYDPARFPAQKVIITNAAHIRLSGAKEGAKKYKRYSGYPGGLKEISFKKAFLRDPRWVIEHAVRGMLPKNKLAKRILRENLIVHTHDF